MKITPEQRSNGAEKTAQSPFNLWLEDKTRGADGRFDVEKMHQLASEYGIDKRDEYDGLNPGQQRMNIGNLLRARVPEDRYSLYQSESREPKIFGTWFWGFDPFAHPFAGFTHKGSRDSLLARSKPGDLILVVGTQSEPTTAEQHGRALGLIEFLHAPMQAEDLIPPGSILPERLFDKGRFKWPFAVPAARAWMFSTPPLIRDAIGRQLTSAAITGTDPLSPSECEAILDLDMVEVELPPSAAQLKAQRLGAISTKLDKSKPGQPGPPPREWSGVTARSDGPTATYLMRFAKENIWKIGISQNVKERCNSLNFSVPSEALEGRCWTVVLTKVWPSGTPAYAMEQALLSHLKDYATRNERVRAHEEIVTRAWQDYLLGRL